MEVTMKFIRHLFLIFTIFLIVACKEPEAGFVFLENATNEALHVTAMVDGVNSTSKPLVFNLNPGQKDGWRFIVDKKDVKNPDSTFKSLLIKSEKCERTIDRSVLENNLRKNGAWILRIDSTLFFC